MSVQNGRPLAETAAPEHFDPSIFSRPSDSVWGDKQPAKALLQQHHRLELMRSGISDTVIDGRAYVSVGRTNTDLSQRDRLRHNGMSKAVYDDVQRYPGLLLPQYSVKGERRKALYKPDRPRKDDKGRFRKYEAPVGVSSVLDLHPYNRDRIIDPGVRLWIVEGIKKGDALTSHGECAIALAGVYNWRSRLGTLGDWEDVPLRGREVFVCFDSDALTNRNVARAMYRLGRWLRSQGSVVRYVIPPAVAALAGGKTGVDDFLAHGGSVPELLLVASSHPPDPDAGDDSLTDARLAERLADDVLAEKYRFVRGLGWLSYEGGRWRECGEERVVEETRQFFRRLLAEAAQSGADGLRLQQLSKLLSAHRIKAVAGLTKGMEVICAEVEDFDADPWLLNCPNGTLDLRTGDLYDHDPLGLHRHMTSAAYVPGSTHPDWETAQEALPDPEGRAYVQMLLGTGATGVCPREDVVHFIQGNGSNGKSTVLAAVQTCLGSYARSVLPSVLGGRRDEHPTDLMDLMGARLIFGEETAEGHMLDVTKLKRFTGTEAITARRMRQDPVSFAPTHTALFSTNYRPLVTDTDRGTWRRLRMIEFPVTFGEDGTPVDRGLRQRLIHEGPQQEAVLAYLVEGARSWYEAGLELPDLPAAIVAATDRWRRGTDLLYSFATERLAPADPARAIDTERLREAFNDWLPPPHREWGRQIFAERVENHDALKEMGARRGLHPTTRRSCIFGIKLVHNEEDW